MSLLYAKYHITDAIDMPMNKKNISRTVKRDFTHVVNLDKRTEMGCQSHNATETTLECAATSE